MEKAFGNNSPQEYNKKQEDIHKGLEKEGKNKFNEQISEKAIENLYSRKEGYTEKRVEPESLLTEEEKAIKAKLEEEVTKMKSTPSLEEEAKKRVEEIKSLKEREKLKYLLNLASERGISFAIRVAQKMKDPYTLDMFRDILAMNKIYEHFSK